MVKVSVNSTHNSRVNWLAVAVVIKNARCQLPLHSSVGHRLAIFADEQAKTFVHQNVPVLG